MGNHETMKTRHDNLFLNEQLGHLRAELNNLKEISSEWKDKN